ncbi:hypothetical protein ACWFMI_19865 [Nocardiopsis terrae]
MFGLLYPHLTTHLGCVSWEQALILTAGVSGACVVAILFGILTRTHRLLHTYYVRGGWPGMVHHTEKGPQAVCGVCGHHLAVHDRSTGRCCHGTPMDLLAVCIALPLPLPVRAFVQQAGCPCRLRPDRR